MSEKCDFDKWNEVKKSLYSYETNWITKEREVYWVKLGQNIGFEQNGKGDDFLRPVLIFKKFNKDIFLGIPFTSNKKDGKFYFEVSSIDKEKPSYAILSQIKLFSTKRIKSKFGKISIDEFEKLKESFVDLIMPPKRLPD